MELRKGLNKHTFIMNTIMSRKMEKISPVVNAATNIELSVPVGDVSIDMRDFTNYKHDECSRSCLFENLTSKLIMMRLFFILSHHSCYLSQMINKFPKMHYHYTMVDQAI